MQQTKQARGAQTAANKGIETKFERILFISRGYVQQRISYLDAGVVSFTAVVSVKCKKKIVEVVARLSTFLCKQHVTSGGSIRHIKRIVWSLKHDSSRPGRSQSITKYIECANRHKRFVRIEAKCQVKEINSVTRCCENCRLRRCGRDLLKFLDRI